MNFIKTKINNLAFSLKEVSLQIIAKGTMHMPRGLNDAKQKNGKVGYKTETKILIT